MPSNRVQHYRKLRDCYTNYTYVEGNVELSWLKEYEHLDLSFVEDIREVIGYVLIAQVNVQRVVLPNLQIIRGRTLFKLGVTDEEFALVVTLPKMYNLEISAFRGNLAFSNCCPIRLLINNQTK